MSQVFLSYRRSDSPDTVKLLHERLKARLPRWTIFYDHHSIPAGERFPERLKAEVTTATVVLAVIGPRWMDSLRERSRSDATDHVREELRLALASNRLIVPVPVLNAPIPSADDLTDFPDLLWLPSHNARPVRPEPDFEHDLERLVAFLEPLGPSVDVGTVLGGKYKLVEAVGEGGMGVVYRAEQLQPSRAVAVKLIKPGLDTKDVLARFDAERQALAMMSHPNIAGVIDAGQTPAARPYFVMDFVAGVPITEYCDERRLALNDRLALFMQICDAVQHAHQKGIIHRDLKPSNVLVETVDGRPVPKVIDFGLAKALSFRLTDKTLVSELGRTVGTLLYSSPEQAAGRVLEIDTRTDVYSLGVLLYEMLAGSPPFGQAELEAAGDEAMRRAIREQDPPKPSTRLSSSNALPAIAARRNLEPDRLTRLVRGELDWIVMKALEKEQGRRYGTANQLGEEVRRFLANEPVKAGPPSAAYRARKFVRRNRSLVIATTLLFLALVAGVVGTATALAHARAETSRAESAEKEATEKAQLAEDRRERESAAKTRALQSLADFSLERGRGLVAAGDLRGLLWVGRALEHAPPDDRARRDLILANLALLSRQLNVVKGMFPGAGVLSPAGDRVVTYEANTARLWRTADCTPVGSPMTHEGQVEYAYFSPDGKTYLIRTDLGIQLWNSADGTWISGMRPGKFEDIAFSPDGKTLCTTEVHEKLRPDGTTVERTGATTQLWSTKDGSPIGQPLTQTGSINHLAFSADGQTVLTRGFDEARLWKARDGTPLGQPMTHPEQGLELQATPSADGQKVLVWRHVVPAAVLWDTRSGKPVGPPIAHTDSISEVAFSPDGKTLLTASSDHTARLWNTADGTPVGQPLRHDGAVWRGSFSPDGRTILTGSGDRTARLWNAADGTPVGQPMKHDDSVEVARFSPDGKFVITSDSKRSSLRFWNAADGSPAGQPITHPYAAREYAISPDGKVVATGRGDNSAKLWSVPDGRPIGQPMTHPDVIHDVAFTRDGTSLFTTCRDGTTRLWQLAEDLSIDALLAGEVVRFHPDSKSVVIGSGTSSPDGRTGSGVAQFWSVRDGKPAGGPLHLSLPVTAAAFSPDGKTLLTGTGITDRYGATGRGEVQLWNASTGQPIGRAMPQRLPVQAVAFSPDGNTILVGTGKTDDTLRSVGEARLWSVRDQSALGAVLKHDGSVRAVAFSPRGDRVVTGCTDNSARLWNAADGSPVGRPMKHDEGFHVTSSPDGKTSTVVLTSPTASSVDHVAFSPDGKTVLTGSWDGTARLWNALDGTPIGAPMAHRGPVQDAAFSPDGATVLTASSDRTARLWNAATGAPVGSPLVHAGRVNSAVFSPDGKAVLTSCEDKAVRLWSTASGTPIGFPLVHPGEVFAAGLSPDGRTVFAAMRGRVQLWRLPPTPPDEQDRMAHWVQLITSMELRDSATGTAVEFLDAKTWEDRRKRLTVSGGPPNL